MARIDANRLSLEERVVDIRRVSKVVKGGRRFSYSVIAVVGDKAGHVGAGVGKAAEVPDAIRKAVDDAKKHIVEIPLHDNTIPHPVQSRYCASTVLLRPASIGTGVIAGAAVRAVVESAGVRDVLSKTLGSSNKVNTVAAAMQALGMLESPAMVARRRTMTVHELLGSRATI
jgi:small subunit ribosomal protein S5